MEPAVKLYAHDRPGVLVVALNRPKKHNALDPRLIRELTAAFHSLRQREDIRVVVLTGEGRSFCAGADLQSTKDNSEAGFDLALEAGQGLFDLMMAVDSCPFPLIGRINGSAIGGGIGLVSCCDMAVAVDRAKFGFSEVRLGLIPAVISPFVLSKISASQIRQLYLTGERFDAMSARAFGLLHWVVREDDLDETVDRRLDHLLRGAPGAQRDVKRLLGRFSATSRQELRGFTSDLFARRIISREGREGIHAFLEKRRPDWIE